ncbi:hypothetical protein DFH06DRAFT_1136048 [Mycena polygramma]|nr:hypothetical protein DFH06DRAFT_1136048 [Mycena polygramma]
MPIVHPANGLNALNDDCLLEICSHILTDGPMPRDKDKTRYATTDRGRRWEGWRVRRGPHRDILALALTSKQCATPALDVLWSEIDGLVRVLKVLPASEFRQEGREKYIFNDPQSWDRFDFYAHKVRKVKFVTDSLDPAICARITKLHIAPLFPNLNRFTSSRKSALSPTMILIAPWLRQSPLLNHPEIQDYVSVDAFNYQGETELAEIGFGRVTHSTEPTNIISTGGGIYEKRTVMFQGFAASLPSVCSLDLTGSKGGFHLDDLRMLASLPCLTSLAVWIEGPGWPDLVASPLPIFPALQALDVGDTPRSLLPHFLCNLSCQELTSLTVSSVNWKRNTAPVIQAILDISAEKWATTLSTLFLNTTDHTLTAQGYGSLARLTSLEHLRIGTYRQIHFTDAEILAIIQPLRNLVSLNIFPWHGLTIEALRQLARHLLRLRSLELTFEPPTEPPTPETEYIRHGLETMIVNASTDHDAPWLENIEATACHLHHIFPSLRTVYVPSDSNRKWNIDLKDNWEKVEEYLYDSERCPLCSQFL